MSDLLIVAVGLLLVADTVFAKTISNWNMGVALPALLGVPLIAVGLLRYFVPAFFLANSIGSLLCTLMFVLYVAFAVLVAVCVCIICFSRVRRLPEKIDAVIVLGAGLRGERPSRLLRKRLDKGMQVANEKGCPLIVSGGQGANEVVSEACAMRNYLLSVGFSANKVLMEEASRSTYENFAFSRNILAQQGIGEEHLAFVTSDFHVFRAQKAAKHAGLVRIAGVAAPSAWYMAPNFYLRETLAIVRYVLLGVI